MSETCPPEGDQSLGPRPPETGELPRTGELPDSYVTDPTFVPPPPAPPRPPKQKLHWGFALLGFVTPWPVVIAAAWGFSLIDDGSSALPGALAVGLIAFWLLVAAWISGRRSGNNRLRSYGIGGLVAYIATVLLSLLAVGACFISLGKGSLFGN
jgi:hypothetical protein